MPYTIRTKCPLICFHRGPGGTWRFLQLGTTVTAVCLLSFGPFIYMGQLRQVLPLCLLPFTVHAPPDLTKSALQVQARNHDS